MIDFKHFRYFTNLLQLRSFGKSIIDAIPNYGTRKLARFIVDRNVFLKQALAEIKAGWGNDFFPLYERQRKAYITVSGNAAAITVAHSYRTIH